MSTQCADDCQFVSVNKLAQKAILKIEADLRRLHLIEELAREMAEKLARFDFGAEVDGEATGDPESGPHYRRGLDDDYWEVAANFNLSISNLIPEANIPLSADAEKLRNKTSSTP